MKQGTFPNLRFVPQIFSVLYSPPTPSCQESDFVLTYTVLLYLGGDRQGLPSSESHLSYIPFPIYRRIFIGAFPVSSQLPWFSPNRTRLNIPYSPLLREVYFTIRQNSLYVTVCTIVSTPFGVTLPTRLAPCISTTHRV